MMKDHENYRQALDRINPVEPARAEAVHLRARRIPITFGQWLPLNWINRFPSSLAVKQFHNIWTRFLTHAKGARVNNGI